MHCGILLQGSEDVSTAVAIMDEDNIMTWSVADDNSILDILTEHRPTVIAFNAPQEHPEHAAEEEALFRSGEQDLIEDGYQMLPRAMRDPHLLERAEYLATAIRTAGIGAELIESHPRIVMQRLDIAGDDDLEQYGVTTTDIENVHEFEAVVLALAAKLYDEDHYEDKDLIIPKELE